MDLEDALQHYASHHAHGMTASIDCEVIAGQWRLIVTAGYVQHIYSVSGNEIHPLPQRVEQIEGD